MSIWRRKDKTDPFIREWKENLGKSWTQFACEMRALGASVGYTYQIAIPINLEGKYWSLADYNVDENIQTRVITPGWRPNEEEKRAIQTAAADAGVKITRIITGGGSHKAGAKTISWMGEISDQFRSRDNGAIVGMLAWMRTVHGHQRYDINTEHSYLEI